MKRRKILGIILGTTLLLSSASCGFLTRPPTEREATAGLGGLIGGASGAIIGSFAGSAVAGGLFGIPLGALVGYYIGDQWGMPGGTREARASETSAKDSELARLRDENERLRRQAQAISGEGQKGSSSLASTPKPEQSAKAPETVMVRFDFNKSAINGGDKQTLSPVVAWLKDDSDRNVTVEGHTDSVGPDAYNFKLSEKRAVVVRDYLVQNGVGVERITIRAMGKTNPVAPNDTEAGREKNRRVEIISNGGARTASASKPQ